MPRQRWVYRDEQSKKIGSMNDHGLLFLLSMARPYRVRADRCRNKIQGKVYIPVCARSEGEVGDLKEERVNKRAKYRVETSTETSALSCST